MKILALLLTTGIAHCELYNIKPSLADKCPQPQAGMPCLTLSQIQNRTLDCKNLTLRFLPGVHTLHLDYSLRKLDHLKMSSYHSDSFSNVSLSVNISCKNYSRFRLSSMDNVVIDGLNFQKCGGNRFSAIKVVSIFNSRFIHNSGAAMELKTTSTALIRNVFFLSNSALSCNEKDPQCCLVGGAMRIQTSNVTIISSVFADNMALSGGAIFRYGWGNTEIFNSTFTDNKALCNTLDCDYNNKCKMTAYLSKTKGLQMLGGAINAYGGQKLQISKFIFIRNRAITAGGALHIIWARTYITHSLFSNNSAVHYGGAMHALFNTMSVTASDFYNNSAVNGGALDLWKNVTLTINSTILSYNKAETGAVLLANANSSMTASNIHANHAKSRGVLYIFSSSAHLHNFNFSFNNGSLYLFNSNITVTGKSYFSHNTGLPYAATGFQGGAISAFQSSIIIDEKCNLMHNHAQSGGAIHAAESKIWTYGAIEIAYNSVYESGGGIHLYQSDLNCLYYCKLQLVTNTAVTNGGGIRAISSSVKVHLGSNCKRNCAYYALASITFIGNRPTRGGAISLEVNAKLYIFKISTRNEPALSFISNNADKGGAIYIADDTNFGTCSSSSFSENKITTECFLQSLALHHKTGNKLSLSIIKNTKFDKNLATQSGHSLYGGLLDRCTVSFSAEVYYYYDFQDKISPSSRTAISGASNFFNITNATIDSVSSDPVSVCFCKEGYPDCSYDPPIINVKRGEKFEILYLLQLIK